ncbi:hypothetical protein OAH41_01490 [Paracoccaceae bacterium]|nr:hypothetical protein [Paracoccaceae bacterium]
MRKGRRKFDYIFGYCEDYETDLVTSKHIIIRDLIKDGYHILYIENPVSFFHLCKYRKKVKILGNGNCDGLGSIEVLRPVVPLLYTKRGGLLTDNRLISKINSFFVYLQMLILLRFSSFNNVIAMCYLPSFADLLQYIRCEKIIYHVVDDFTGFRFGAEDLKKAEDKLVAMSDVVITTSKVLFSRFIQKHSKVINIDHGVDYLALSSNINQRQIKPPNKNYKCIYFGALHKVDWKLVESVSLDNPDVEFDFFGPIEGPQGCQLQDNFSFERNVRVHNSIAHKELVKRLNSYDFAFLPFVKNKLTLAMNPLKVKEAFAAGLPVFVSLQADHPLFTQENLSSGVFNFDDKKEFADNLLKLQALDSLAYRDELSDMMRDHGWQNILECYRNIMEINNVQRT